MGIPFESLGLQPRGRKEYASSVRQTPLFGRLDLSLLAGGASEQLQSRRTNPDPSPAQPRSPYGPPPDFPSCAPAERFLSSTHSLPEVFPPHNVFGGTYDPTSQPDLDDPDDVYGTFDAPSQQAVSTPPHGAGGAGSSLPHPHQPSMVEGTARTVTSRTHNSKWGGQPGFLAPGVYSLTGTLAQDDAERQARLDYPGWPYPHQEIVVAATAATPSGTGYPCWGELSFFPPDQC